MKPTFQTKLSPSFCLYLEHKLLDRGEAYTNFTGQFYGSDQDKIYGKTVYQSPHAQWVYDSSISGALIPTGVFLNNQFVGNNLSGIELSYQDGRVYLDSAADRDWETEES